MSLHQVHQKPLCKEEVFGACSMTLYVPGHSYRSPHFRHTVEAPDAA